MFDRLGAGADRGGGGGFCPMLVQTAISVDIGCRKGAGAARAGSIRSVTGRRRWTLARIELLPVLWLPM